MEESGDGVVLLDSRLAMVVRALRTPKRQKAGPSGPRVVACFRSPRVVAAVPARLPIRLQAEDTPI
jgi:hypothetical protein